MFEKPKRPIADNIVRKSRCKDQRQISVTEYLYKNGNAVKINPTKDN